MKTLTLGEACQDIFLGINVTRQRTGSDGPLAPVVLVKHIGEDGLLGPRSQLSQSITVEARNARYLLLVGDILLTARGSVGRSAIVADEHVGTLASSNLIVIRPDIGLRPQLILAFLRHPSTQAALLAQVTGSALPTLNIKNVSQLQVRIPPEDQQAKLAELIALGEAQYTSALEAARLRREIALDMAMRKLAPFHTSRSV